MISPISTVRCSSCAGESGNLLSRHARDFLTRWRDGATIMLGPTADATTATIRLTP